MSEKEKHISDADVVISINWQIIICWSREHSSVFSKTNPKQNPFPLITLCRILWSSLTHRAEQHRRFHPHTGQWCTLRCGEGWWLGSRSMPVWLPDWCERLEEENNLGGSLILGAGLIKTYSLHFSSSSLLTWFGQFLLYSSSVALRCRCGWVNPNLFLAVSPPHYDHNLGWQRTGSIILFSEIMITFRVQSLGDEETERITSKRKMSSNVLLSNPAWQPISTHIH